VTPQKVANRNRLDHILPQGYLEGFTSPEKPGRLWVFNIERGSWFESDPGRVAAERGYYDYSEASEPGATADQAFAEFETNFPPIIRELVASIMVPRYAGWRAPKTDSMVIDPERLQSDAGYGWPKRANGGWSLRSGRARPLRSVRDQEIRCCFRLDADRIYRGRTPPQYPQASIVIGH